ncbi:MAG TPA: hypothetical protein VFS88_09935 [Micavibrio sp.]|nr:hypothetical protein [Micavibrio sp.]
MARSPDNDSKISRKFGICEIPDAPNTLQGVKAPFGRSQFFDVLDRAQAAGVLAAKLPAPKFDR